MALEVLRPHLCYIKCHFCAELLYCPSTAMQETPGKNTYGRFTTVQLFIAAVLKVTVLLWRPFLLHESTKAQLGAALMLYSFSLAFNLSAYCIFLLIFLERTKITLASPRLQNICVLLGITAVFTLVVVTFDLLVLYRELYREY